jgi:prepilin peptidase dependent protein B
MLKTKNFNHIAGFTFTELMIALVINVLLFAAVITLLLSNLNHYRRSINGDRLNQQLQSVLSLMSNDIRRAGYWANASNDIGLAQNNNPFMANGLDIGVYSGNQCILFSYDQNNNGVLPAISAGIDDERYGFRLTNQAVQARIPGAAFDCGASSGSWENMTDTKIIQITNLAFTLSTSTVTTGPGTQGIMIRNVDISITGRLASDTSVTKTLTQHVRIRNDKFLP